MRGFETRSWILDGEHLRTPDGLWKPYRQLRQQILLYQNYVMTVDKRLIPKKDQTDDLRIVDELLKADEPVDPSPEHDVWVAYKVALKEELRAEWKAFTELCASMSQNEYMKQFYNNDWDMEYVRLSLLRMQRNIV